MHARDFEFALAASAAVPLPQPDRKADDCDPAFRKDVLDGLSQSRKVIPARWFYDLEGSRLFEQITGLADYYPTRVETALLRQCASLVAARLGTAAMIVEFGSGSSIKTRMLLDAMPQATYVPVEICGAFLAESCATLARDYPEVAIVPVEANFMDPVQLPPSRDGGPVLGFFPGSTIGNLLPSAAVDLLRTMRVSLGAGSNLLIGMDAVKSTDRLLRAYDDDEGITARFNLNLLHRINRELQGTIPVGAFRHRAVWNAGWTRIEMHLEAMDAVSFEVAGEPFRLDEGETIHTENCHKYTPQQMRLLLQAGGWSETRHWTDGNGDYALILAEAVPDECGP
ncbi:dimethylhistidine N-methyltransferase [Novosphingobium sp. PhB165]|uniref:L-histidine N(alpha)-methyltransferase n=1 Tax=Novosphingobium sp. PhB165 TaxID=2485105 RepID=UPI00104918E6|nr:L-histidine N(alpha)-methyltransferase [Novosphingobium sp. PhB165]TCM20642.1 dimethylhistidine N-methyltransferase [Novosphingobium sp. PhB165]